MHRRLLPIASLLLLLLFLFPACQGLDAGDGQLTVTFPLETTELTGLQSLRVTLQLQDRDGQPVEGASVQAELRAPSGDVFATLDCVDRGQGRYQADYVQLPMRGSQGTWRVTAQATWDQDKQSQVERAFKGLPSLSEEIQAEYGFWVDVPGSKGFGYSKLWHYAQRNDDGSGYVFIDNRGHGTVRIDTHWQQAEFPLDEAAARAYAKGLPLSAERAHPLDPKMTVEETSFQGQRAWLVVGRVNSSHGLGAIGSDIEWLIFHCPDTPHPQGAAPDWLWTLVIHTSNPTYVESLRATRETFECPK